MKNTLKVPFLWKEKELILSVEEYTANKQIAILLYDAKTKEYFSDLSVYIVPFEDETYMAVDTNNFPSWEMLIRNYNLWDFVTYIPSGFYTYPVYDMKLEELEKWDKDWVKKFSWKSNPEE